MKCLLLAALLVQTVARGAEEVPAWLADLARQPAKSYPAKVSTVVLLAEEHLTVDEAGRRTMRERGAVRILAGRGGGLRAYRSYNARSGKLRSFQAWLVRPGGAVQSYGKDKVLDIALDSSAAYNEGRAKVVECDRAAPEGSVFGWEVVEEESTLFTTYPYSFQEEAPVEMGRFTLTLPAGWEARWTMFNHERKEPAISGNSYTWELRDLPWLEGEEHSVGWQALAPRLGITYWPKEGSAAALKPLGNWGDVSAWMTRFVEPAVEVTPAIEAKARALAQAEDSEWGKIRAVAEYVQKVNYVSVQMNVTRGGGYSPNAAGRVLERNYGDCKDKVTLMRALLKALGVETYTVAVFSGSRGFVRREWPSAQQFNHVITAVKVGPGVTAPTVVEHESKGRLLVFDVTDPVTPLGGLDEDEQGSWGMLVAESGGGLLKLPVLGADSSRIERRVEAEITGGGGANAVIRSVYHGQAAAGWMMIETRLGADEVRKRWERMLSRRAGGVTVAGVKSEAKDGAYTATVEYSLRQLGKLMQGRLLIVTPGMLAPEPEYRFAERERREPVELRASSRTDSVVIKAPDGFTVDELPAEVNQSGQFGSFQASWRVEGALLLFEQKLKVNDAVVQVKDYRQVKAFFDEVAGAGSSPVVLMKK